ncbi:Glutathione S-transferase U8 [Morella rubra]|uniref:glutathione transferase n=1 Tax=Morella rubra TaxID=262757 RepID=A0A6A1UU05_9ROSI|nr:Glutathione S-transferase U8 [Morella rubra]
MAEEVLLFGTWVSPFSRRIELALKLKGVQYKYVEEDLNNKSPALLQYNPVNKKIPVLVHNGKSVVESQSSLNTLMRPGRTIPYYLKILIEGPSHVFGPSLLMRRACWGADQKEREKAVEEVKEQLQFLEDELNEKRFFGGEKIGFVDIVGNIIAFWFGVYEEASGADQVMPKEKFPKLCKWANEIVSHSVIKESLPPRDKMIAYYRKVFGPGTSVID